MRAENNWMKFPWGLEQERLNLQTLSWLPRARARAPASGTLSSAGRFALALPPFASRHLCVHCLRRRRRRHQGAGGTNEAVSGAAAAAQSRGTSTS